MEGAVGMLRSLRVVLKEGKGRKRKRKRERPAYADPTLHLRRAPYNLVESRTRRAKLPAASQRGGAVQCLSQSSSECY